MANELRVRANLLPTLVLTSAYDPSSDTTIAADELASWPVIDATNHMAVTVDWDRATGTPFILYITAHTSAATTATVAKDQEGTTATSVPIGTECIHGPTEADFYPQTPDISFAMPKLIFAEEFNGEETTDPTDLTTGAWLNQGGSTFVRRRGRGVLTQPTGGGSYTIRGVEFTAPSLPTSFLLMGKVWVAKVIEANYHHQGIGLRESSSNKCFFVGIHFAGAALIAYRATANLTTEATPAVSTNIPNGRFGYFGIRKNSADNWDAIFSMGGAAEIVLGTSLALDSHFTPDRIFFGGDNRAANNVYTECDWIRMWDLT